jgi:hypothetical protein
MKWEDILCREKFNFYLCFVYPHVLNRYHEGAEKVIYLRCRCLCVFTFDITVYRLSNICAISNIYLTNYLLYPHQKYYAAFLVDVNIAHSTEVSIPKEAHIG